MERSTGKSPISTGPFSIRPTACPGETPLIKRRWQRGPVEISVWTSGDMRSNRLVLLYIYSHSLWFNMV